MTLVLVLFSFILFVATTNAASICKGGCGTDEQGFCEHSSCYCFAPYYGDNCQHDVTKQYPSVVFTIQIIFCVAYGILGLFTLSATILGFKYHHKALAPVINVRQLVLVAFTIQSFCEILVNSINPLLDRSDPTLGMFGHWFLLLMSLSIALFSFVCVLFHWIDLVNLSLDSLKKEQMLQQVSIYYKGKDITLEDMVGRVKFLKKLRIPFGIFLAILFLQTLAFCIIIQINSNPELFNLLIALYFVLWCLYWIILSVGFLVWGRRLVSIMPSELTKKIAKVTTKLTILSAWSVLWSVILILLYSIMPPSSYAVIIRYILDQWVTITLSIGAVYCFVDKSLFKPVISKLTSGTASTDTNEVSISQFPLERNNSA